jgi:hypothetical protein
VSKKKRPRAPTLAGDVAPAADATLAGDVAPAADAKVAVDATLAGDAAPAATAGPGAAAGTAADAAPAAAVTSPTATAAGHDALVPTWPHLIVREATLVLGLLAALTVAAVVFAAPLGPAADPSRPENPEKAPWYFVGLQEMASYSTSLGAVAFPLALGALLCAAPLCGRASRPRVKRTLAAVGFLALVVTAGAVALQVRGHLGGDLLNPAGVALAAAALAAAVVGMRTRSARGAVMAALAVLAVAYLVFVLVGALCRGPGWQFLWPWQAWPEVAY